MLRWEAEARAAGERTVTMGPAESMALSEATGRIVLLVLGLAAVVILTVRLLAARRHEFHAHEPRPEDRRQEEYHLAQGDEDDGARPRF